MDSNSVKLGELNDFLLQKCDSWRVLEETYEDEDITVSAAYKNNDGEISKNNGEVWCLSSDLLPNLRHC